MAATNNQPVPGVSGPGIIFPSASRTAATYTSPELFNANAKGVKLYVTVSVVGTSVTVKLQVFDPASQAWIDLSAKAVTAAIASTTPVIFTLYPGIVEVANVAVSDALPVRWRVVATGIGTNTFSVGGDYIN
jgi:hypothetical protein